MRREAITTIKTKRRRTTLSERTTPCACCGYPISHRHHPIGVAETGESRHTLQFCPNCHELFHLVQAALVRKSRYCNRVLQKYVEARGWDNTALKFMFSKVIEVEDIRGTFTCETSKIVEAVRRSLEPYVRDLRDIDILGTFDMVKNRSGVRFKVGARVSEKVPDADVSESLWVFHFNQAGITKVETLRVTRGTDGLFVPILDQEENKSPNKANSADAKKRRG